MSKITTIGLDLAKNVFHVVCCDARGKVVRKRMLKRRQVLAFFGNLERCLVGMEACAGSHHWCRELEALGFEMKLIAAGYVKAYVRGNKNDYNDGLAIAEAVVRPEMRFVAVKTPEQQDIQALHRVRRGCIDARTVPSRLICVTGTVTAPATVTVNLAAHRRGGASQRRCDRSDGLASDHTAGDLFAFRQAQR